VIGGILAGLGIDYSLHFLSHYNARRAAGLPPQDAIRETIDTTSGALLAAWATSVIGFCVPCEDDPSA